MTTYPHPACMEPDGGEGPCRGYEALAAEARNLRAELDRTKGEVRRGFAVLDDNGLDMRTVSDTRRAAIVNWLVAAQKRMVFTYDTDAVIEAMWSEMKGNAQVVPVSVQAFLQAVA